TDVAIVKLPGERLDQLPGAPPAWLLSGHGLGAMIYIPLSRSPTLSCRPASCEGDEVKSEMRMPIDHGWFGVGVVYEEDAANARATADAVRKWVRDRDPQTILNDAFAEWEGWRKAPPLHFMSAEERSVWLQSETILRMSQVREPNIREPGRLRVNH